MKQNPSSPCQDAQGWPSLEVAGEGILLDRVLTPRTNRSCQAGFGKPSAVMVTDSSRSFPAKPHPRAGTPQRAQEVSEGLAQSKPGSDVRAAGAGLAPCPSPPAALPPPRAGLSVQTKTIPTKAPDSTGLSSPGEKNPVAATPTLT